MEKLDIKINYILNCLNKVKVKNTSISSNEGLKEHHCKELSSVVNLSRISPDKSDVGIKPPHKMALSLKETVTSRGTDSNNESKKRYVNTSEELKEHDEVVGIKPPHEIALSLKETVSSRGTDSNNESKKHYISACEELKEHDVEAKVKMLLKLFVLCKNQSSDDLRSEMLNLLTFFKTNARSLTKEHKFSYVIKSLICILLQRVNIYSCMNSNSLLFKPDVVTCLHELMATKPLFAKIESMTYSQMAVLLSNVNINYRDKSILHYVCYVVELFSSDDQKPLLDDLLCLDGIWPDVELPKKKQISIDVVPICNIQVLHWSPHLHLWAYIGTDIATDILRITNELQTHSSRKECLLYLSEPPQVGEMYGFCSAKEVHRVRVLEVTSFVAKVFAIDFAIAYPVTWTVLFFIPKSIQDFPPLAKLCQIKGVVPRPDVPILIDCVELLQELGSFKNHQVAEAIKANQGDQILFQLTKCPDPKVQMHALGCLLNLTTNQFFQCSLMNNGVLQEFSDAFKYHAEQDGDHLYKFNEPLGLMFRIFSRLVAGSKASQVIYVTPEDL